jgi:hypothetical protein
MAIVEPQLTVLRPGIGVTQVYLAIPDRFDLGTFEYHSRLNGVLDKIVMVGLAIDGYYVGALRHTGILAPGRMTSNA